MKLVQPCAHKVNGCTRQKSISEILKDFQKLAALFLRRDARIGPVTAMQIPPS